MTRVAVLGIVFAGFMFGFDSGRLRAEDRETMLARLHSSVVMVVVGKDEFSGFIIARDPPLVATVAHMAIKMEKPEDVIVRANETGMEARVKAVHVHKGYKKDRTSKDPYGPDVAILELEGESPDLGSALSLAPPNTDADLRGLEIVLLGFPFYSTLLNERESPAAVFRRGSVQRMLDDDAAHTTIMPLTKRPMFQHDLSCLPGESGAPIVSVLSGAVVGVQNGDRKWKKTSTGEMLASYSVAVHADKLWEVAEQANLTKALEQAGK